MRSMLQLKKVKADMNDVCMQFGPEALAPSIEGLQKVTGGCQLTKIIGADGVLAWMCNHYKVQRNGA